MSSLLLLLTLGIAQGTDLDDLQQWTSQQPVSDPHPEVAADYRFTSQLFAQITAAAKDRPGVVTPEVIGSTVRGRPIWAFHVRRPSEPVERKVLVFGGIHALEWISVEVATDLLLELIEHPPRGISVTVIPMLNPDGRAKVEADLVAGRNAYRRGNGAKPPTDLNRDYAHKRDAKALWRHIIPNYYKTSKAALSQPESRALDGLLDRERYDRAASLHAYGGYFFFPWAGDFERTEDFERYMTIGRAMEKAQRAHAYRPRQLGRWGFFFRGHGMEIDHMYGEYGTLAYLVEMTRSGIHPLQRKTWKTYFRWYNPVRSDRHRHKGVAAMRALIRTP